MACATVGVYETSTPPKFWAATLATNVEDVSCACELSSVMAAAGDNAVVGAVASAAICVVTKAEPDTTLKTEHRDAAMDSAAATC